MFTICVAFTNTANVQARHLLAHSVLLVPDLLKDLLLIFSRKALNTKRSVIAIITPSTMTKTKAHLDLSGKEFELETLEGLTMLIRGLP